VGYRSTPDKVVSRAKFTRNARRTVYLYARPKVETNRDYQILITAESIELIISSIDSAYPRYIRKICLFLLYVLYEKSYYNVKCKKPKIYLMYVRMYTTVHHRFCPLDIFTNGNVTFYINAHSSCSTKAIRAIAHKMT